MVTSFRGRPLKRHLYVNKKLGLYETLRPTKTHRRPTPSAYHRFFLPNVYLSLLLSSLLARSLPHSHHGCSQVFPEDRVLGATARLSFSLSLPPHNHHLRLTSLSCELIEAHSMEEISLVWKNCLDLVGNLANSESSLSPNVESWLLMSSLL